MKSIELICSDVTSACTNQKKIPGYRHMTARRGNDFLIGVYFKKACCIAAESKVSQCAKSIRGTYNFRTVKFHNQLLQQCTARTVWSDPAIRPVLVHSGKLTARMVNNEKQKNCADEPARAAMHGPHIGHCTVIHCDAGGGCR